VIVVTVIPSIPILTFIELTLSEKIDGYIKVSVNVRKLYSNFSWEGEVKDKDNVGPKLLSFTRKGELQLLNIAILTI
jgi:hypothetical protein